MTLKIAKQSIHKKESSHTVEKSSLMDLIKAFPGISCFVVYSPYPPPSRPPPLNELE